MTLDELVGANIRGLRQTLGLSQEAFGEAMSEGFAYRWSRQVVGYIEAGERGLTLDEIHAVAAFFAVSPTQLLVSQRDTSVEITGRSMPFLDYARWWRLGTEYSDDGIRGMARVLRGRGIRRPWAELWRRVGKLAVAYREARERVLNEPNRRHPGPIYVWEGVGPLIRSTPLGPWATSASISLEPGIPYTCRDEFEADELAKTLEQQQVEQDHGRKPWGGNGLLRTLTPQQAYRMTKSR